MNKRDLKLSKYGISPKRYKELCGFCEQYPEWKAQLATTDSSVKSAEMSGMPHGGGGSDPTQALALRRLALSEKCETIEKTARQASSDLWKFVLLSVCYEVPVTALIMRHEMPLSKSAFYELRRYFYYLLDKNKR